ncbi:MAG: DUF1292 domain-containing protein [Clostridia bacterium]|nr:DUF1292 domain-containing protein [Clostridia bacterium]
MKKEIENENLEEEVNPIDQILDENNMDNIILYNDKNEPFEFEQIAVIPLDEGENQKLYAILLPVTKLPGIEEDEAVTFELVEEDGTIRICEDDAVIDRVLEEYEKLLEESEEK